MNVTALTSSETRGIDFFLLFLNSWPELSMPARRGLSPVFLYLPYDRSWKYKLFKKPCKTQLSTTMVYEDGYDMIDALSIKSMGTYCRISETKVKGKQERMDVVQSVFWLLYVRKTFYSVNYTGEWWNSSGHTVIFFSVNLNMKPFYPNS